MAVGQHRVESMRTGRSTRPPSRAVISINSNTSNNNDNNDKCNNHSDVIVIIVIVIIIVVLKVICWQTYIASYVQCYLTYSLLYSL